MPSASSKPQASQQSNPLDVLQEPVKSACSVADKKLRNLEKRRLKLLETKKKADKGEKLNEDQKNALKSLESVDFGLETVKDIQKNLSSLEQEYSKLLKKDQKRQKLEQKDKVENQLKQSVINVVEIQAILGELSEEVRPDFLAGTNGACQLTETDFENLDSVYELINPAASEEKDKKLSERVKVAGQHLANLVEGKPSAFVEEVTYKEINELLQKIKDSGYFDKEDVNGDPAATEEEVPEETPVEEEQKPLDTPAPVETPAELESPEEESPVAEEPATDSTANTPVNGVDLPSVVQETPEEEGFKFMGESEISAAVQEAPLNPVSPEFVPRKMQPQQDDGGFDNAGEGNDSNWQQIEGGHGGHQGNYRGRGGRGRGGRGRGGSGGRGGGGNYRGNQRDGNYRGRGGSGNYRGNREGGSGNYRGNREGGSGNYRGNREGGRGSYRGGQRDGQGGGNRGHPSRGGGQHQQQQA